MAQAALINHVIPTVNASFEGALTTVDATHPDVMVIKALFKKPGGDPSMPGEAIPGQVLTAGADRNSARQTA